MDQALLSLLRSVDTPTVCNAIEVAQGKRGFANFTRQTMLSSDPAAPALVGYARTARIAAVQPSSEPADKVRAMRMEYYRHMASGQGPRVAVVEDLDGADAIGAFWGEINSTVHKGLGLDGVVTNGLMRDLGDIAPGFQIVAGAIGPSHGFVHVEEVGTPVTVFGLQVQPDDLVHADRHGALVIPADLHGEIAAAIAKLQRSEAIILDAARAPDFDFEKFEAAWAAFEASRT